MSVNLFVPTYRIDECLEQIRECLERGWTGLGFKTVELEQEWKKYTGLPNAYFTSSATAGLHLAVKLLKDHYGWHDGDEVITTPFTFVSTNHAIVYENLTPVFADIDEFLCLDPLELEKNITPKTRAVMFVGMGGSTGQWPEIVAVAKKHGLKIILDAAHMAGTRLHGKNPGLDADMTVYSFHSVKNMPTADSGMLCCREPELDERARRLGWLGINKDTYSRTTQDQGAYKWLYEVDEIGYKYHGNSIMAAIALTQLKYLDEDNARRRLLASRYDACFKAHQGRLRVVATPEGCETSRHIYSIEVGNRDELMLELNRNGIYPGVHYRDNTEYSCYAPAKPCPAARRMSGRVISLPLHLRLTGDDVERVAEVVAAHAALND